MLVRLVIASIATLNSVTWCCIARSTVLISILPGHMSWIKYSALLLLPCRCNLLSSLEENEFLVKMIPDYTFFLLQPTLQHECNTWFSVILMFSAAP